MPVNPTYPGLYIEELPSLSHSITAAPTSVTVFIGYTHPFLTSSDKWGKATEIFGFSDYQKLYGGLYNSPYIPSDVAYAVQQFFLNGGAVAYVVALQPQLTVPGSGGANPTTGAFPQATAVLTGTGLTFTGLAVVDANNAITVTVRNVDSTGKIADLIIAFGTHVETYRQMSLDPNLEDKSGNTVKDKNGKPVANPRYVVAVINGGSTLVTVADSNLSGATFTGLDKQSLPTSLAYSSAIPSNATVFNAADFINVLQENTSLDKVSIFNLMVIPAIHNAGVMAQAEAFCERKRAFLIMDPDPTYVADATEVTGSAEIISDAFNNNEIPQSTNSAVYFPYVKSTDPLTGQPNTLPPSGTVAGMYAKIDNNRGVWKAPAGLETVLTNVTGVVDTGVMTDPVAGVLNNASIDAIRSFPGIGTVIFGARTTVASNTAFEQWKYVPVRRTALFIEQSLYQSLGWAVFEPNDEPLWTSLRTTVEAFMLTLFHQGAFQGSKPSEAFLVKCDATTTTQDDINHGIVNILVAFAPLKPAEFVIIQIAQLAGQAQSS